jgi:hypothetical protein
LFVYYFEGSRNKIKGKEQLERIEKEKNEEDGNSKQD